MQTRYPPSILEEELKNNVAADFFGAFDCSRILGKVDFCAAVCHSIEADWLNDRDQFLYPNDGWRNDFGFQRDCLVYTLFSDFNVIKSRDGVNHWIPFTEEEVGAKDCFASHFMSDFINGRAVSTKPPIAAASSDATYTALLATLRMARKALAAQIVPNAYDCGFLKR